jgi:ribonuclease P protein component
MVAVTYLPPTPDHRDDPPRVAYAIPRKVAGAVDRTRIRRRLRAAVAELGPPAGAYLVTASADVGSAPFAEVRGDLTTAIDAVVHNPMVTSGNA